MTAALQTEINSGPPSGLEKLAALSFQFGGRLGGHGILPNQKEEGEGGDLHLGFVWYRFSRSSKDRNPNQS